MRIGGPNPAVAQALTNAAEATGVSFDFLMRTAARESSFNPRAQARTSTAAGLFQFLESTWLTTLKRHGPKHGLAAHAAHIEIDATGRPQVANRAVRRELLDLRFNPDVASRLAAEFTRDNAEVLRARIGREPTPGELYAAHFLGAGGAAELIQVARRTPDIPAASLFPEAAAANRGVFYHRFGGARSVADLLDNLQRTASGARATELAPSGATIRLVDLAQPAQPAAPPQSARPIPQTAENPFLTAQFYRPSDEVENQAAVMALSQMLASDGPSLADVLSPQADEPGRQLNLRGRS
jgi:hypothetical protein